MIFRVVLISWQGVRSRLGRSALTALSLFVGVLAIVIIQAGAGAVRNAAVASALLTGGRALTLGLNTPTGQQSFAQADRLRMLLDRELAPIKGVCVLTVDIDGSKIGDGSAAITFVRGNLRAIRPFPIRSGTWLGSRAGTVLPLVLNAPAGEELELSLDATTAIQISAADKKAVARVVGIVEDGSKESHTYAPLDLAQPWVNQLAYHESIRVLAHVNDVANQANFKNLFRTEYARVFDTNASIEISRVDRENEFTEQLATIGLIFSVVAGLSLLVGALGILNIGLSTLKERSDELSLRRSFGATKLQVAVIVVLEGQIVALAAAGVALYVGHISFPFVASLLSQGVDVSQQTFPVAAAAMGVAASCAAAFAGSLAPAIRASSVPIASIMRV